MLLGCLGHIGWVTVSFFEWLSSHSKIDSLPHLIISNSIFKIYSHVQPLYSILIRCHDTSERASRPMSTTVMVTQFKTVTQSINHKPVTSRVKIYRDQNVYPTYRLLYIVPMVISGDQKLILEFFFNADGNPRYTLAYRMKSNLWVFVFCSNFI